MKAEKQESLLYIDTMNCDGNGQAFLKFPELQYLKKEGRDEVDFLHADLNATSLHYLKKEVRDRFLFAWK